MIKIELKKCSICGELKGLESYYSQNKKYANGNPYVYYPPYCKDCTSKKAVQWYFDNTEQHEKNRENYRKTKKYRKTIEKWKPFMKEYEKQWRKENPDKLKEYNLYREMNKKHEITEKEWSNCKEYFNFECAYCGLSEEKHRKIYNQQLHKEHVDHNGANDLSNCVPACKSCNSKKHNFKLEDWYIPEIEIFNLFRLNRIYKWLNDDYLRYIESK